MFVFSNPTSDLINFIFFQKFQLIIDAHIFNMHSNYFTEEIWGLWREITRFIGGKFGEMAAMGLAQSASSPRKLASISLNEKGQNQAYDCAKEQKISHGRFKKRDISIQLTNEEILAKQRKFEKSISELLSQNIQLLTLSESKSQQIQQLEDYIVEISDEFSAAKAHLKNALERLEETCQLHEENQAYDREIIEGQNEQMSFLKNELQELTDELRKEKFKSRELENQVQRLLLQNFQAMRQNKDLKKKNQELKNKTYQHPLAQSQVLERIKNMSYIPSKTVDQTDRSTKSQARSGKSFFINNSLTEKIVFKRIRSRSLKESPIGCANPEEASPGMGKKRISLF